MIDRARASSNIWFPLGIWLLILSACSQSPAANAPGATSAAAPASSARPTAPLQPTPVLGSPKALRDDIQIRKILETGGGIVRMKRDPSTDTIYYMTNKADIYQLIVKEGNASGKDRPYTLAKIGGDPKLIASGMAFGPDGTLYVLGNVSNDATAKAFVYKGKLDADKQRVWTTLVSTEPYELGLTQFDHMFNGIVVSPDGRYLYINSGSRSDHGEVEDAKGAHPNVREVALTSAIFRVPTDVDNQVLPNDEAQLKSKGYLFADGTRNSYDLAFGPNGDLFAADNSPDADYPDELNWLQEGHHYGFPWRFSNQDNATRAPDYDPAKDPRLQEEFFAVQNALYKKDPDFPPPPAGVTFTDPIVSLGPDADVFRDDDGNGYDASDLKQPIYSFTPHRSGLGLVFDTAGALGGDLKGDGLMVS
ncbi:MAG TPA: PQQ-dependent sugar dehydrogenase, partial [Roseiflexaceae bacterium]|nr:PQQ-dependent sugar dehydrogenase [Roseiflexaceae bacterium]